MWLWHWLPCKLANESGDGPLDAADLHLHVNKAAGRLLLVVALPLLTLLDDGGDLLPLSLQRRLGGLKFNLLLPLHLLSLLQPH